MLEISRTTLCLGLCALPLTAQETEGAELQGRDFFPANYGSELFVDFGALKEHGIWAGFERSLVAPLFGLFDQHFGFALGDLDELRMHFDDGGEIDIAVFRGAEQIGLPPFGLLGRPHDFVEVAGLEVMHDTRSDDYYVSPRPGLLVYGSKSLVMPVLRGERKGGVPSPELQSLTSGRGNLAYAVLPVPEEQLDRMGIPGLPQDWYAEDDLPKLMAFRTRLMGDEESGHRVVFQATIRHQNGDAGPARLKKLVEEGLAWLSQHPRMGAFKRHWQAVELEVDGRDLTASLDLGAPREAAGVLPLMLGPSLLYSSAEAVPQGGAQPQPTKPEKGKGKGKGSGKIDQR